MWRRALRVRIGELEAALDAAQTRVADLERERASSAPPPATYAVTCRHCGDAVLATPRIGEVETGALHAHLDERHRDVVRPDEHASKDALLAQYRVAAR